MLKMQSKGSEAERPQSRKTESVAPIVDMSITVVTCNLSDKAPWMTCPKTDIVLNSVIVTVPAIEERPIARA